MVMRGHLAVGLLLTAFLVGYFLSWCVGLLGYCYVLPWRGFSSNVIGRHFAVTATMVFLAVCATCVGGWVAVHLVRPAKNGQLFRGFPRQRLLPQLAVFGASFLAYQIISLAVIGLNARWELGNSLAVGSDAYWVAGLRTSLLAFYALLGFSLSRPLWSAWNLRVAGALLTCLGLNSLTGGRELALEPFVVCAAGALFSPVGSQALVKLSAVTLPVLVAVMLVVGWVRDSGWGFAGGSASDKLAAAAQVLREGPVEMSAYRDPIYQLFSRLFEPSAQDVIDSVTESKTHLGWIDFERVPFVLVPQFIYPEKLSLNDGPERLIRYHGYRANDYSAAPLTILADAYERFGVTGVIAFHLAIGIILVFAGRLVLSVRSELLAVILLVCFAKSALRLYSASVLQFISATSYAYLRDALVISSLFVVGRRMHQSVSTKARSLPHAHPVRRPGTAT
jgi:hypothetical protein